MNIELISDIFGELLNNNHRSLCFSNSRMGAEEIFIECKEKKIDCEIHRAGLPKTERERVDEMVRSSISKVFEQKHNAIEEQFVKGQALYKLKISKLEKEAGSKHQQEKELMSELSDMAKESGKSFVEVMSDLIKSNKIKAK